MKWLTKTLLRRFARAARPYLQSEGLMRTSKVFSGSALVWNPGPERVVVLAPHMDDETIGCGGAVARHIQAGGTVHVVFLTDGRNGSSQLRQLKGEARRAEQLRLVGIRKEEAQRALHTLGVHSVSFFDGEDGDLQNDSRLSARLRELLQAQQPEIVYVPCFLEQHSDHYAASRILVEATRGSTLRFQCMAYEVWTPLFPNCLVKIDEVLELKKSALQEYRSQLADANYLHTGVALNAFRSAGFSDHYGRYAEAYCSVPLEDYRAIFDEYRGGR
jgi:LmbE family N-acetylglucosaminyl deacetylase